MAHSDMAFDTASAAPVRRAILPPADIKRIMYGLMLGLLLAALDMTIVGPALPTIGHDLGHFDQLPWVVTAYLLVSTACTPLYGKLADIHGRRIMLLTALGMFVLGSVACALAPTMLALILARGLQGIGGGGIMSLTQTIVGDLVSPKERVKYQIYISLVWVVSNLAGPVLGGYFAASQHWTGIFWINLPLGLAAWLISSQRLKMIPRHERPHSLDYLGAALMMTASTLLLLALSWGGREAAWGSHLILSLFVSSALVWGLFVVRLLKAKEPLIPLTVLRTPMVSRGMWAMFFAMGSYIALTIYVPIYLQNVLGLDVGTSGLAMVPLMFGTTVGAIVGTRLIRFFKRYLRIAVAFMVLAAVAHLPIILNPAGLSLTTVEICLFLAATGIGPVFPLVNIALQSAVPLHELGTTTALVSFMRSLGASLEVAVIGSIVVSGLAAVGIGVSTGLHGVPVIPTGLGPALAPTFTWVFGLTGGSFVLCALWLSTLTEPPMVDRRGQSPATPEQEGHAPHQALKTAAE